jgi:hypothetical protein
MLGPRSFPLAALVVSTLATAPARAQERVSVAPYLGTYVPVGLLVADSTVEMLQLMTLMVGTRVAVPVSPRLAVEVAAGWTPTPSWVAQSDWQQTVDIDGKVALASARGRYRFDPTPAEGDWRLSVVSGVGVVHRYGRAWEGIRGTTDATLLLGGGLDFGASTARNTDKRTIVSRVSYGLDFESLVSRAQFTNYIGQRTAARLHVDLIASLSLRLSL